MPSSPGRMAFSEFCVGLVLILYGPSLSCASPAPPGLPAAPAGGDPFAPPEQHFYQPPMHMVPPSPPPAGYQPAMPPPQFASMNSVMPSPQFSTMNNAIPPPMFPGVNNAIPSPQFPSMNMPMPPATSSWGGSRSIHQPMPAEAAAAASSGSSTMSGSARDHEYEAEMTGGSGGAGGGASYNPPPSSYGMGMSYPGAPRTSLLDAYYQPRGRQPSYHSNSNDIFGGMFGNSPGGNLFGAMMFNEFFF